MAVSGRFSRLTGPPLPFIPGLVGPLPAFPEAVLTYLFESKLATVPFDGYGVRPEMAVVFGLLFVHVNCRTKVSMTLRFFSFLHSSNIKVSTIQVPQFALLYLYVSDFGTLRPEGKYESRGYISFSLSLSLA